MIVLQHVTLFEDAGDYNICFRLGQTGNIFFRDENTVPAGYNIGQEIAYRFPKQALDAISCRCPFVNFCRHNEGKTGNRKRIVAVDTLDGGTMDPFSFPKKGSYVGRGEAIGFGQHA